MKHPHFLCNTPLMQQSIAENKDLSERRIQAFWRSVPWNSLLVALTVILFAILHGWLTSMAIKGSATPAPQSTHDLWEKSPTARDTEQREVMSFSF